MAEVIDLACAINVLSAYRARLREQGKMLKAVAVEHCIAILKRL